MISKTWINDGQIFGGFYVFADAASAESYVAGDLFQNGVVKDPGCRSVQIKHYDVFSELTAITGGSAVTLVGA